MNEWHVDETKSITTHWLGANPDLLVEYRSIKLGGWIAIGVPTNLGGNMHTIEHKFDTIGEYLIRIKDINNGLEIVDKLSVVVNTAAAVCDCVETSTATMSNKIDTIDEGLRQVLREVTTEVQENQTILENTGFKVTI